jgi:hypothetical protein
VGGAATQGPAAHRDRRLKRATAMAGPSLQAFLGGEDRGVLSKQFVEQVVRIIWANCCTTVILRSPRSLKNSARGPRALLCFCKHPAEIGTHKSINPAQMILLPYDNQYLTIVRCSSKYQKLGVEEKK